MLPKNKNSWVLSVENNTNTKYHHHYFCSCTKEFKLQTEINEPDAPDVLCPLCGNDYFKDADAFENMKSIKIWKYFKWTSVLSQDSKYWKIRLNYEVPMHNNVTSEVKLNNKELLHIKFKKDGSASFRVSFKSKTLFRYSLFLDDRVQAFKKLLVDEAKESLYRYIMMSKSKAIEWIDEVKIKEFTSEDKLNYLTFYLKNTHLKEHRFFFWKMKQISKHTLENTTQIQMLDFIANKRREKSVRKALYRAYENSIQRREYHPYSDYVFSRTVNNVDFLIKLYKIHPVIKQQLFTDETFDVAIRFILFLKQHYTEKQIAKLFVEDIQNEKEYKNRLNNWRDTLRMLQTTNAFNSLEEHFSKVKLTTKKLHDEIVRVFHIVSYELDAKEDFEYDQVYLDACCTHKNLEFKLPSTVKELSLWAKILHNCMCGYSRTIHQQESIIYGVFKEKELLYAVELNGFKIMQAKAISNKAVPDEDMKVIRSWLNNVLV